MKRKLFMVAIAAVSMCVMVSCGKKDNKDNKANSLCQKYLLPAL